MASEKRPYAATANVLGVLDRVRTRNLPDVVDNDFLRVAGVPDVVFGRVMHALRFLDLADEEGRPNQRLKDMASAPDAEYREKLAECIRGAYEEDFARIDPTRDSQAVIVDAFQRYEPRSQTTRMVMLFLGLCRAAGMPVLEAPRERKMQATPRRQKRASKTSVVSRAGRRFPVSRQEEQAAGTIFRVTEDDIAVLKEDEFEEIWKALGKVARARAQARHAERQGAAARSEEPNTAGEEAVGDNGEAPGPQSSGSTPGASEGGVHGD